MYTPNGFRTKRGSAKSEAIKSTISYSTLSKCATCSRDLLTTGNSGVNSITIKSILSHLVRGIYHYNVERIRYQPIARMELQPYVSQSS
jgi:uncharacterized protein YuzB (UPF0349 family)